MRKILSLATVALTVGSLVQFGCTVSPASAMQTPTSFNVAGWSVNSEYMNPAILKQVKAAERVIVSTGAKSVTVTPYTDNYGPLLFNKYIGHARAFAVKQFLYSLLKKDNDRGATVTIAATTVAGKPRTLAGLATTRKVVISYVAGGTLTGLITGIPRAADATKTSMRTEDNEFVFPTLNGCAATQACYWVSSVTAQLATGGATYTAILNPNVVDRAPTSSNYELSGGIAYSFTNLPAGSYSIQVNFAGLDYNSTAPVRGTAPNTYGEYTMFAGNIGDVQVNGTPGSASRINAPWDDCQITSISIETVPVTLGTTSTVQLNSRFFDYNWC